MDEELAKNDPDSAELERWLEQMASEHRLVDFLVDLLASTAEPMVEVNGMPVARLNNTDPPTSDKSCYKNCLKEEMRGGDYAQCIKKCKPSGISITVGGLIG